MDRHPIHTEDKKKDELVEGIRNLVRTRDWAEDAKVRFQEEGQVYFGDIVVTVKKNDDLPGRIEKGLEILSNYHWKIHDVTIMPVKTLPKPEGLGVRSPLFFFRKEKLGLNRSG